MSRVIAVHEQPSRALFLEDALLSAGFQVEGLSDWRECLRRTAVVAPTAIVLSDSLSHQVAALDLIAAVRILFPATRAIVLSSMLKDGNAAAVDALLPAGCSAEVLSSAVHRACAEVDALYPEAPVGVVQIGSDHRVRYANKFAERLFALDIQTLTAADVSELLTAAGYSPAIDPRHLLGKGQLQDPASVGCYATVPLPGAKGGFLCIFCRTGMIPVAEQTPLSLVLDALSAPVSGPPLP